MELTSDGVMELTSYCFKNKSERGKRFVVHGVALRNWLEFA